MKSSVQKADSPLRVGICGFGVAGGALAVLLALGRDLALPLLCALPWTRRQMERSVSGEKQGFFHRLF